jgi:hypothetical protein
MKIKVWNKITMTWQPLKEACQDKVIDMAWYMTLVMEGNGRFEDEHRVFVEA